MSKKKRSKKNKTPKGAGNRSHEPSSTGLPWLILSLLTFAFGVASFLAWAGLQSGPVVGCGPESGCGDVLSSRWSSWFGIPVSLLALPFYGVLLGATVSLGRSGNVPRSDLMSTVALGASLVVILAAAWFIGIQALVIGKFCPWCLAAHAAGLCASLLIAGRLGFFGKKSSDGYSLPAGAKWIGTYAGGLGVALLVGGQWIYQPDTFDVATMSSDPGSGDETGPAEKGELKLHGGRFELKVSEYPLIGKPDAGNYLVSLFDYTCRHCRATHHKLKDLYESFSEDLAIESLPMPLNGECNSMMRAREVHEAHRDACHYARLSLSVFRLKPSVWHELDDWLFAGGVPPAIGDAISRGAELVGDMGALQREMQSEATESMIEFSVSIYEANVQVRGQGSMPQMIIGNRIVTGEVNDASRLYHLVAEEFGLQQ